MSYSLGHHFHEMVSRILLPEFDSVSDTINEPLKDVLVENMLICHNSKPEIPSDSTFNNTDISMGNCPICLDALVLNNSVTNTCNHSICDTCALRYLETQFSKNSYVCCSICRHPLYLLESSNESVVANLYDFVENCRIHTEESDDEPLPIFEPRREYNRHSRNVVRTVDFDDYDNILLD